MVYDLKLQSVGGVVQSIGKHMFSHADNSLLQDMVDLKPSLMDGHILKFNGSNLSYVDSTDFLSSSSLTSLDGRVGDLESSAAGYALSSDITGLDNRVQTLESDHVTTQNLSDLTGTVNDHGTRLSDVESNKASTADLGDLVTRVDTLESGTLNGKTLSAQFYSSSTYVEQSESMISVQLNDGQTMRSYDAYNSDNSVKLSISVHDSGLWSSVQGMDVGLSDGTNTALFQCCTRDGALKAFKDNAIENTLSEGQNLYIEYDASAGLITYSVNGTLTTKSSEFVGSVYAYVYSRATTGVTELSALKFELKSGPAGSGVEVVLTNPTVDKLIWRDDSNERLCGYYEIYKKFSTALTLDETTLHSIEVLEFQKYFIEVEYMVNEYNTAKLAVIKRWAMVNRNNGYDSTNLINNGSDGSQVVSHSQGADISLMSNAIQFTNQGNTFKVVVPDINPSGIYYVISAKIRVHNVNWI